MSDKQDAKIADYKQRIRKYLQDPKSSDDVWGYVLDSLMDVSATMGLDLLDKQIYTEEERKEFMS